ncbi:MAG: FecR family protein [Prosthecobacter sp.]
MKRMEDLLEKLRAQTATSEELSELKRLLTTPEGRAKARERLWMECALHSAFRATPVLAVLAKRHPPQPRAVSVAAWANSWIGKRWVPWAAAAAAMILGAMGWLPWTSSREDAATLSFVAEGGAGESIAITRDGRTWHPVSQENVLVGDSIELAEESPGAQLQFDSAKTTITLQPGATFRVLSLTPQKRFALDRGTLRADVAHQRVGKPMLIQTPMAEARVLGTVFTLAAESDQTGLTVERGSVRLSQGDGSMETIKAGQAAVASLGAPVRLATSKAGVMPAQLRQTLKWIKGPVAWDSAQQLNFDFKEDRKLWILLPGSTWESDGLQLGWSEKKPGATYLAVSPYFTVRPGERLTLSGRARVQNGAELRFNYYKLDGEARSFGHATVKAAQFGAADAEGLSPFEIPFQTVAAAELHSIALILYCHHADGTPPQVGDAVLLHDLTLTRR